VPPKRPDVDDDTENDDEGGAGRGGDNDDADDGVAAAAAAVVGLTCVLAVALRCPKMRICRMSLRAFSRKMLPLGPLLGAAMLRLAPVGPMRVCLCKFGSADGLTSFDVWLAFSFAAPSMALRSFSVSSATRASVSSSSV
jgi:hypothetical protein